MEVTQSKDGAAPTAQLPTSSATKSPFKRNETQANLAGRSTPPKKQETDPAPRRTFEPLSAIILAGRDRDGNIQQAALDEFSDVTNHNINLRPVHFSYEKARTWAAEALQIPREGPIDLKVIGSSESLESTTIRTSADFTTVLTKLWCGTFEPVKQKGVGNMLVVGETPRAVPPAAQPAVQVAEFQEQEPEPKDPSGPEVVDLTDSEQEPQESPVAGPDQDISLEEQQPLPANEFLKLVREAATANDVSLKPAEIDEPGSEARLYKFDPRILKKALLFFNTNLNDKNTCKVKGIKGTLHLWQIYTAYDMFMNAVTNGVNGLCISLDVGYGKTRLALLFLRARARICALDEIVKKEWDSGKPDKHLPRNNKDSNARCPSQESSMVQCPCSWDPDTRQILEYMTNLPALIMGPPTLKETWIKEMRETFLDYGTEKQFLTMYYLFGEKTAGNDLSDRRARGELVEHTRGDLNPGEDGTGIFVDKANGTASDVFIISNHMATKLVALYQTKKDGVSLAAFGVFIMDEFQKYKGTEKSETIAFRALEAVQTAGWNPLTLFVMCGTAAEEGPSLWRAPIKHFNRQFESFGREGNLLVCKSADEPAILRPSNTWGHIAKIHKRLVRGMADQSLSPAEIDEMTKEIRAYVAPFMRALRQNQVWRGLVLNQLPGSHDRDVKIVPCYDKTTKSAIQKLLVSINSLITEELDKKKRNWRKRKTQASTQQPPEPFDEDEPTREDVIEGQLVNDKQEKAWLQLSRGSAYPYLTVLQSSPEFDTDSLSSSSCQMLPVSIQNEIEKAPEAYAVAISRFNSWTFSQWAEQLKANSPKLQLLLHLIEEMVNDNDPATKPPKDDPCKKRYAIVYHTNPISAVITYFFLITDTELCKKIQPILFTAGVKSERRQEIMQEMVRPGKANDRNKILIASTEIAAEGFNLQRVNNVWFMELPPTLTKVIQAVGRALRSGQTMKVNVVKMYDEENLLEMSNIRMLQGKRTVSERIYNAPVVKPA